MLWQVWLVVKTTVPRRVVRARMNGGTETSLLLTMAALTHCSTVSAMVWRSAGVRFAWASAVVVSVFSLGWHLISLSVCGKRVGIILAGGVFFFLGVLFRPTTAAQDSWVSFGVVEGGWVS